MKNFDKNQYSKMEFNGYKWAFHSKGIHTFTKKEGAVWTVIECSEEQLYNGDIQFLTEHGLTIGKELKKSLQK